MDDDEAQRGRERGVYFVHVTVLRADLGRSRNPHNKKNLARKIFDFGSRDLRNIGRTLGENISCSGENRDMCNYSVTDRRSIMLLTHTHNTLSVCCDEQKGFEPYPTLWDGGDDP